MGKVAMGDSSKDRERETLHQERVRLECERTALHEEAVALKGTSNLTALRAHRKRVRQLENELHAFHKALKNFQEQFGPLRNERRESDELIRRPR
jgi:hypothetical protein